MFDFLFKKKEQPLMILVVEPSMLMRDRTYIMGPYPANIAKKLAKKEIAKWRFGKIYVEPVWQTVMLGKKQLWPRKEVVANVKESE